MSVIKAHLHYINIIVSIIKVGLSLRITLKTGFFMSFGLISTFQFLRASGLKKKKKTKKESYFTLILIYATKLKKGKVLKDVY